MSVFVSDLQIGEELGRGHFGVVHLGTDEVHGKVAVKVLSRLEVDPETGQRETDPKWHKRRDGLLQEAQNLAKATHPNVVQVHHFVRGDDGESLRFSMELCAGGSLQRQYEDGPLSLPSVRRVGTEVTLGLQALHLRGMLHRDIKPANILIDRRGTAKIGDFGLVTDDLVFGYASAQGYLDHVAYEVWQGEGTSVKSDIWALGMTLYRLIHGAGWYEQIVAPRNVIKDGGFVNRLKWLPHVPPRWKRVIRQMMNDDTEVRYQNCEQLLAAFATLPVPPWRCEIGADGIVWKKPVGARQMVVEQRFAASNRAGWTAWTEPLASGRKHTLGGSNGRVAVSQCKRELEAFFRRYP